MAPSGYFERFPPALRDRISPIPGRDGEIGDRQLPGDSVPASRPAPKDGAKTVGDDQTISTSDHLNHDLCGVHNQESSTDTTHNPEQPGREHLRSDKAIGLRLREARIKAGYPSASGFARLIGMNVTTYLHHEMGRRSIAPDTAKLYSQYIGLDPGELLFRTALPLNAEPPIIGIITTGGQIRPMKMPSVDSEWVGHVVAGDDLYPAYRDGDVVMHRDLHRETFNPGRIHGVECVVELASGELMLRQVAMQADGRATLIAYASPPLIDQQIVAAEPVAFVRRRLPGE